MKKQGFFLMFMCFYLVQIAQINIPKELPFKKVLYKNSAGGDETYNTATTELKAFLLYDISTQPLAEAMFNGTTFVFENVPVTVFPVLYVGDEMKKINKSVDIQSKIPVQIYRSFEKTQYEQFHASKSDYPIMIFYNEKNHLCGFAKNVEQVNLIDCDVK